MRAVVLAIVAALPFHAYADGEEDAALVHLDRGIAAFDAKDFRTAEHELSIAHELAPDKPNPFRWLALTEIQLGDCTSALEHIDGFIARVPSTDPRLPELIRWKEFCTRSMQPAQPTPAPAKPLHARWWFWPAIGTTVLAITGVTIYAATHGDEPLLPPVKCTNTGCM